MNEWHITLSMKPGKAQSWPEAQSLNSESVAREASPTLDGGQKCGSEFVEVCGAALMRHGSLATKVLTEVVECRKGAAYRQLGLAKEDQ